MKSNVVYAFLTKVHNVFLKAFITIWVARIVGPNEFGNYSLILTIASIITLLLLFGSHNFLLVKVTKSTFKQYYINLFNKYYLIITVLLLFTSSLILLFLERDTRSILITSIFISTNFYFFSVQYFFMVQFGYKKLLSYNVFYYILFILIIFVFGVSDAYSILLTSAISELICVLAFMNNYKIQKLILSKRDMRVLRIQMSFSSKSFIIDIQNILMQRMDFLILSILASPTTFGIYAAGKNIAEALLFIPKTLQPFILQNNKSKQLRRIIIISLTLLAMGVLILIITPSTIMRLAYGNEFLEESYWLQISLVTIFIYSLLMLRNSKNISLSKFKNTFKANNIAIIMIILFSLIIFLLRIELIFIAIIPSIAFLISLIYLKITDS